MSLVKILPEFVTRPWGCRTLAPIYEMPPGVSDPIGEAWLTSMECRVALTDSDAPTGTLGEFWSQLAPAARGNFLEEYERFPLLLKIIFTSEKLSVQVHPGDEYAQKNEGEPWGKTEAWHILHAEPGAWVKVGFEDGVSSDQVQDAWGKAEIEGLLNHLPVATGDIVFVPPGTVHAIGPGLCLVEIQQYSDITYRVYDYGRLGLDGNPRPLHLERARAVTRLHTPEAGLQSPSQGEENSPLLTTPYFSAKKYCFTGPYTLDPNPECFAIIVFYRGKGGIRGGSTDCTYQAGETYLLPSDDPRVVVEAMAETEMLRVTPSPRASHPRVSCT